MHFLDQQGNYYSGEKAPGGIEVSAKPSANYKLKEDWRSQIPDVWEFDLGILKASLLSKINLDADVKFTEILAKYPKGEVDTWPQKAVLAQNWLDFTDEQKISHAASTDFALLFNESVGKSVIVEEDIPVISDLATRIIRSRNIFSTFAGAVLNCKTAMANQVKLASTEEELLQFSVDYTGVSLNEIVAVFTPVAPAPPAPFPTGTITITFTSTGAVLVDSVGNTEERVSPTRSEIVGTILVRHTDGSYILTLPNGDVSPITTEQELAAYIYGIQVGNS